MDLDGIFLQDKPPRLGIVTARRKAGVMDDFIMLTPHLRSAVLRELSCNLSSVNPYKKCLYKTANLTVLIVEGVLLVFCSGEPRDLQMRPRYSISYLSEAGVLDRLVVAGETFALLVRRHVA